MEQTEKEGTTPGCGSRTPSHWFGRSCILADMLRQPLTYWVMVHAPGFDGRLPGLVRELTAFMSQKSNLRSRASQENRSEIPASTR